MSRSKRTVRVPGKVDFENMGKLFQTPVRFRIIQNVRTREVVRFYGYSGGPHGPWVGYDPETMKQAPCTHCGRQVFAEWSFSSEASQKFHLCLGNLGKDSMGNVVPCPYDGMTADDGTHVCDGKPSMSYHGVKRWTALDYWAEVKDV